MKMFAYIIHGADGAGMAWRTGGQLQVNGIAEAYDAALRDTFQQLTDGKAVFGHPGVGRCRGPYKISMVTVWEAMGDG